MLDETTLGDLESGAKPRKLFDAKKRTEVKF
jgi:hypothetical protein